MRSLSVIFEHINNLTLTNLKSNLEGMQKLFNYYSNVNAHTISCPFCLINRNHHDYRDGCFKCPWFVFTGTDCEEHASKWLIKNPQDSLICCADELRHKPPKAWANHRLLQLADWIYVYKREIKLRKQLKRRKGNEM